MSLQVKVLLRGNQQVRIVLCDISVKLSGSNMLGDKAYATEALREYVTSRGAVYTISPKSTTINP